MTKENAIKTIRELKRETNDNWYEEVYDMAIEALKAQTTLDDVSTAYENGYRQGKFEALQWIPCSERLPDSPIGHEDYFYDGDDIAADEYIVMIKDAKIPTSLYWTGSIWFSPYGIDAGMEYDVVAWMPLPEPYKGE